VSFVFSGLDRSAKIRASKFVTGREALKEVIAARQAMEGLN
jgi:hypothetical protein